ncbi:hypothetical protein BDV96DRAFT_685460 [Lophiotrema nucula]|uniref:BTB domain-containing protein n=1 Tax=Lophiotrema nucula TaxID=690887 RepID=A0A6A5ZF13_9PLEO|nr:hypothetical protein BDV96DRAFT_685460 [Lophiotrema nucula]
MAPPSERHDGDPTFLPAPADFVDLNVTNKADKVTTYKLPRQFLCKHSSVFSGTFSVPAVKVVGLTDTPDPTFKNFVVWLRDQHLYEYTKDQGPSHWYKLAEDWTILGRLALPSFPFRYYGYRRGTSLQQLRPNSFMKYSYYTSDMASNAIRMFVFADMYRIRQLRMDATDRLLWCFLYNLSYLVLFDNDGEYREWNSIYTGEELTIAYNGTRLGSALRRLLVDVFRVWPFGKGHYCTTDKWSNDYKTMLLGLPTEFLAEVITANLIRPVKRGECEVQRLRSCDYHDHEGGERDDQCEGPRVEYNLDSTVEDDSEG